MAVVHVDYQLRDLTVTAIAAYSGYNTAILNDVMLTGGAQRAWHRGSLGSLDRRVKMLAKLQGHWGFRCYV